MNVPRICSGCGTDQTPLGRGLEVVRNAHGTGLGLFCAPCVPVMRAAIAAVDRRHGAVIAADGTYLASPRGAPDHASAYLPIPRPDGAQRPAA